MANEAYILTGTAKTANTDFNWTLASLAVAATTPGRVSAQIDLGASPRPYMYELAAEVKMGTTPTAGNTVDYYFAEAPDGDATQISGVVGASDANLGDADMLKNIKYIGSVTVEDGATGELGVAMFTFTTTARYISLVIVNNSGAALDSTEGNHVHVLTPKSIQGQ